MYNDEWHQIVAIINEHEVGTSYMQDIDCSCGWSDTAKDSGTFSEHLVKALSDNL